MKQMFVLALIIGSGYYLYQKGFMDPAIDEQHFQAVEASITLDKWFEKSDTMCWQKTGFQRHNFQYYDCMATVKNFTPLCKSRLLALMPLIIETPQTYKTYEQRAYRCIIPNY